MDTSSQTKRTCHYCNKILLGRADQRYCNDTCRNDANRKIRLAERIEPHPNTDQIIKIIKKNYEILKKRFPGMIDDKEIVYYELADFYHTGIDSRFYTSTYTDDKGCIWYCVFDRAFQFGQEWVIIKDFPEQAEID